MKLSCLELTFHYVLALKGALVEERKIKELRKVVQ